jgi:hypothetical protein
MNTDKIGWMDKWIDGLATGAARKFFHNPTIQ